MINRIQFLILGWATCNQRVAKVLITRIHVFSEIIHIEPYNKAVGGNVCSISRCVPFNLTSSVDMGSVHDGSADVLAGD